MRKTVPRFLIVLLCIYGVSSLVHFVHNAEFLRDYPNLPASWSRLKVYSAWFGMTIVGLGGYLLMRRGYARAGLIILAVYAAFGLESLGHYIVAPMAAHSMGMNTTILLEVTTAAVLLAGVLRLLLQAVLYPESDIHNA